MPMYKVSPPPLCPPLSTGADEPVPSRQRRQTGVAAALLTLLVACGAAGCVGPARTDAAYRGKAATSAKDARSAVETAQLAVDAARRKKALGPYLSVLLSSAEEGASSVQATFDSIQPPDSRADDLRDRVDDALQRAVSTLADLRIAARRGEIDQLASKAAPLADISRDLDQLSQAGQ